MRRRERRHRRGARRDGSRSGGEPPLSPLQRAFIAKDAAQCGFCTPGQLVAAHALLDRKPHPTDDEIRAGMSGNLCRCGTYPKILAAIRAVADGEFGEARKPEAGSAEAGSAEAGRRKPSAA